VLFEDISYRVGEFLKKPIGAIPVVFEKTGFLGGSPETGTVSSNSLRHEGWEIT
jgi:hypothetical protein